MKKNILLIFTKILYVLFLIGTIIAVFIVYKNVDNSITINFLFGYMFLAFFVLLYIPFITILNSRKFKWIRIRKRLFKFIILFILFGVLNYIFDYVFRHSNVNLLREFSIALGLSFSGSFADVIILKKKEN